jgi:serine/threonine protein kinase
MLGGAGPLTICDLGQARIGSVHSGKAMPVPYRAPEVILNMEWGNAVDIWSVGLLVCNSSAFVLMGLFLVSLTPLTLGLDLLEREKSLSRLRPRSEKQNDPTILQR